MDDASLIFGSPLAVAVYFYTMVASVCGLGILVSWVEFGSPRAAASAGSATPCLLSYGRWSAEPLRLSGGAPRRLVLQSRLLSSHPLV